MIIFGTSCLGNLYKVVPFETKVAIAAEWFKAYEKPFIDSAGKYGAGLSLECIGKALRALGKKPGDLTISVKLGWRRAPLVTLEPTFEPGAWAGLEHDAVQDISYDGILRCYCEAKELLGGFPIDYVSVHDPDEYLVHSAECRVQSAGKVVHSAECLVHSAGSELTNRRIDESKNREDVLGAYRALFELKARGEVKAVGIGAKDWTVIRDLYEDVKFDWAMFACRPTLLDHPQELLDFVSRLKRDGVYLIDSAVFNGGFLMGSNKLDYRDADPGKDAAAFAFRERYLALSREYGYDPAAPAVEYAFRLGFDAVALNTSRPEKIAVNAAYGDFKADGGFWGRLKG